MFPTLSMGNFQIARLRPLLDYSNMAKPLKTIVADRLAELGRNPFEAARKGSLERSYVNDILIGKKTSVRNNKIPALALALDLEPSELLEMISPAEARRATQVPVMGRIGAGAEILPEFEQMPPEGLYEIEVMVPLKEGAIAFEVEGDSMWPRYDPGDVIICWREGTNIHDVLGYEAAVRTAEGKRYLKRVLKGSSEGTFDLESHNAAPIRGVKLDWVSSVDHVVRGTKWRRLSDAERSRQIKKAMT